MAFSVNTNANAMAALRSLSSTQGNISDIQSQIQSGLKVGSATDDPSTFVISQGMRGDIGGLKAVQEGLSFGSATVNMALAGATEISNKLTDLQVKVTQAENDGLDTSVLQQEADEMLAQISSVVSTANFNGINLLDNGGASVGLSVSTGLGGASISLGEQDASVTALGLNGLSLEASHSTVTMDSGFTLIEDNVFKIEIYDDATVPNLVATHTFEIDGDGTALTAITDENGTPPTFAHGVAVDLAADSAQAMIGKIADVMRDEGFTVNIGEDGTFDVSAAGQNIVVLAETTDTSGTAIANTAIVDDIAGTAFADLENAKDVIGGIMTTLGTYSNRLDGQADFTKVLTDTLEEGLGILVDANLAEVSAKLQSEQTKEQLGIQSLSIANAASQSILGLFR